ncbi:helix-turn-helix domain-containing protein [Tenggerimyces flavus]|uniref:Helix-turn-helix domain-containing protein n=1 Tax=Tenggerimyces flavus TaxID=1708749 RepID=A0ABV7Y688_9ACTN|nr:helix-turn-helix domain-containing protein [Tenggerimyces flavus]MBM7784977.1 excisionase family DNA binding protein [Tenggerimyces flavus]
MRLRRYVMGVAQIDGVLPEQTDIEAADEVLPRIRNYLQRHRGDDTIPLEVVDESGRETLEVPRAAVALLARILAHMAAGRGVSVLPVHAELTTQQAADMLNVSRPFLIGLLEAGEIEFKKVGSHRRVRAESLLDYRRRDDESRRKAADELSALRDVGA